MLGSFPVGSDTVSLLPLGTILVLDAGVNIDIFKILSHDFRIFIFPTFGYTL